MRLSNNSFVQHDPSKLNLFAKITLFYKIFAKPFNEKKKFYS